MESAAAEPTAALMSRSSLILLLCTQLCSAEADGHPGRLDRARGRGVMEGGADTMIWPMTTQFPAKTTAGRRSPVKSPNETSGPALPRTEVRMCLGAPHADVGGCSYPNEATRYC